AARIGCALKTCFVTSARERLGLVGEVRDRAGDLKRQPREVPEVFMSRAALFFGGPRVPEKSVATVHRLVDGPAHHEEQLPGGVEAVCPALEDDLLQDRAQRARIATRP